MSANFSPELEGYVDVRPFRFWCQKVLPLVYDDSLSYYELLCKVVDYLNKLIEDVAADEVNVTRLYEAFNLLENYVNHYFDSLDVAQQIDEKLDSMVADGSMERLISPIVNTLVTTWLAENVDPVGSAVIVDKSLTVSGAAADARIVGWDLEDIDKKFENSNNIFTLGNWENGIITAAGDIGSYSADPTLRTTGFIPVESSTKYVLSSMYSGSLNYSAQVIGYYDNDKVFISRLVYGTDNTALFTTGATTKYIRITELSTRKFPDKLELCKSGYTVYKQNELVKNDALDKSDIIALSKATGNFGLFVDSLKIPYIIGGTNKWALAKSNPAYLGYHILLPVSEGDRVTLTARENYPAIYAMLTGDSCYSGDTPEFVYQYDVVVDEDGEPSFSVVTDLGGDPVSDTRHVISAGTYSSFIVVPNTAYLYLSYLIMPASTAVNCLPLITINGVDINADMFYNTNTENLPNYETVFFDDFDEFNTDVWTRITQDPPEDGNYNSRFYTTSDNSYVEQSCLVLKCAKGDSGDNGTHLDGNGDSQPNEYLAPYISTGSSYAIPSGKISARIKMSSAYGHNAFPAAFFTFGQNALWSYAHEMDIFEIIQWRLAEQTVVGTHTFNAGSIGTSISSHIHSTNSEGNDVKTVRYEGIKYANNVSGTIGDDYEAYSTKFSDDNEWHTYSAVWDENQIGIYIDDELFAVYNASSVGAVDMTGNAGFHYPQDVRFNIKALATDADEGYMFVDWVKIEAVKKTPCTSISHDDIELDVDEVAYINPTFNSGCSNDAFSMSTEDTDVVDIINYSAPTANIIHAIKGKAEGEAEITLTSANGKTSSTFTVTVSSGE